VARAAQIAAEFEARLTLVHITAGVDIYGPGGPRILPRWKKELVDYAAKEIAKLQQDVGTKAEVIIDSGDVHQLLNRAAEQSKGDLLVIGHFAPGGPFGSQPQWLRDHSRVAHPSAERVRTQAEKFQEFPVHGMESLRREVECSEMSWTGRAQARAYRPVRCIRGVLELGSPDVQGMSDGSCSGLSRTASG